MSMHLEGMAKLLKAKILKQVIENFSCVNSIFQVFDMDAFES